jgi:1,4-alpha-glucan branching enzyme
VTNSVGNGVIYDPQAFDWGDDKFHMATGNELVIYEMHIGTFNVQKEGHPGTFQSAMTNCRIFKHWASMPWK